MCGGVRRRSEKVMRVIGERKEGMGGAKRNEEVSDY